MPCELRWLASASTSAFHAAAAVDGGSKLSDSRLATAISAPVAELQRMLDGLGLPRDTFWRHVVPLSTEVDSNRKLADIVLRKIGPAANRPEPSVESLATIFTDLERATVKALPDLLNELELRSKPLQQQWEARGPGLLNRIGRKTDEQLIVPRANVILVHPALGGGGQSHLDYNSVSIEAVVTNPHEQLPEVLRLAWMLAQLNNDLPMHSEMIHGQMLPLVSQLSILPAVLSVAEELELARFDRETVQLAVQAWSVSASEQTGLPNVVTAWWDTFSASRPAWNVALTALARMIEDSRA